MPTGDPSGDPSGDHPDLPIKPPLIFVIATAIGFAAPWLWPVSMRPPGWWGLGVLIIAFGLTLILLHIDPRSDSGISIFTPCCSPRARISVHVDHPFRSMAITWPERKRVGSSAVPRARG